MNRSTFTLLPALLGLLALSACVLPFGSGAASQPTSTIGPTRTGVTRTQTPTDSPTFEQFTSTPEAPTITPSPTPTFTGTPTFLPQVLEQFIAFYYDNINSRNYTLTWSLLTDRFKDKFYGPSQGGNQGYINYWNTVSLATVKSIYSLCRGDLCTVSITLQLKYTNGQVASTTGSDTIVYDRIRSTWVFDYILIPTPTYTTTFTSTATRTKVPTRTFTRTPTRTNTFTATRTFTRTSTPTATPTFTLTFTRTFTATPTNTATYTHTLTFTLSPTHTHTFTATSTDTSVDTPTFTATPTETVVPTFTDTATAVPSDTPADTPTETPTATP